MLRLRLTKHTKVDADRQLREFGICDDTTSGDSALIFTSMRRRYDDVNV